MSYTLVVYNTGDDDIAEAYSWYEQQKKGLGDEFLLALAECCSRIFNYPHVFQLKHKHFRQAGLKRFPYVVVYEIVKSKIIIYSVFHTSRNPAKKFRKNR